MIMDLAAFFRRAVGGLALVLTLGVAAGGVLATPVSAQDAGAVARQANTQLRAAERSMFSGKLEEAKQQLEEATALIEQARAADPSLAQLTSLDRKAAKLSADIARRTPDDPAPAETEQGPASDLPKLPAGATKRIADMDRVLKRLHDYMERDSVASTESRVDSANGQIGKARSLLAEVEERYGEKIPADHPEFVSAKARLDAAVVEVAAFETRLTAAAAEAAAPKPVEAGSPAADRARVEELYAKYAEPLDLVHGNSLVYGPQVEKAEEALVQVQKVESDILPTLQPALAELVERYGDEPMAIDHKLHEMGVPPNERFATKMDTLIRGVRNLDRSRAASAESIARYAGDALGSVDRLPEGVRVQRMNDAKAMLLIGQQLDANQPKIQELLTDLDARIAAAGEQIERDIDARAWAGHVDDFPGPGEVDALADAARAWFQKDERWGGHPTRQIEILAVAVRGPWQVADRDVFGRVIRWRLPIHLAITDAEMKEVGIARVYELSILALEGAPNGAEKAPPYDGYWVGDSWNMRLARL